MRNGLRTWRRAAWAALLAVTVASGTAGAQTALTASGSYALVPLIRAAATAYRERSPATTISVNENENGSRGALAQLSVGSIDLALSDVVADGYPTLHDHRVCVIAFSLIANPQNGVTNLTVAQIRDVLSGKVTNWKDVGGRDLRIVVVNRPRTSGNREIVDRTLMGGVPIAETGIVEETTDATVASVRTTPGTISYAAFTGSKHATDEGLISTDGIVELSIDGVAPTEENVSAGSYRLWTYEHVYTNGAPTLAVSRFLAFLATNRPLLRRFGYLPVSDVSGRP